MIAPLFDNAKLNVEPFPHLKIPALLHEEDAQLALNWLHTNAPWELRVEHFYEQEEFSLLESSSLPDEVKFLLMPSFIEPIREAIRTNFGLAELPTVADVNAHRLTPGQTIRVHNDFIDGEETHRLLVQLNSGWTTENGGLLMLFNGPTPEELHSIIMPKHRSAFAFQISHRSFHAVSQIKAGKRYTLVYSFREHS
jgi:Rps23 Pro-64 3,4-dihydroxylase Tpa1-like proline 4-hydroxylase